MYQDNWISIFLKSRSYPLLHKCTTKKFQIDFRSKCEEQVITNTPEDT